MKNGHAVTALTAAVMGMTLLLGNTSKVAAAGPAPTGIKNVVLVHGAFADGSGWDAVAKILEKDGYTVSVAQPPETSYADDQKYTKAAIDAMGGPVVLVGHSYGGSIISEAGNDPNVAALVSGRERLRRNIVPCQTRSINHLQDVVIGKPQSAVWRFSARLGERR